MADASAGRHLTGLDWLVIVAAAVSLAVLITWMVQGQPGLPRPAPAAVPTKPDE